MKEGRTTLPDGGAVGWRIDGEAGPWLVLLRPLGGSMHLWGRFRDELSPDRRVLAIDVRGTGVASRLPRHTSLRLLAHDVIGVFDDLAIERADLCGESMGGMIASWVAAEAPPRVQRLVLISTPVRAAGMIESTRGMLRGLALAPCLARPSRAAARCLAHRILSKRFREAEPDRSRMIEEAIASEGLRRAEMLRLLAAVARFDARRLTITAPTLRLRGIDDPLVHVGEVIGEAGHAVTYEQPVAAAALVRAFLS